MSAFTDQTRAMFAKVRVYMDQAPREFVIAVAEELVVDTPGPGLQYAGTEYVATGRLRGGWSFSLQPLAIATNLRDGPYDESGAATISAISDSVKAIPLPSMCYLVNNVVYGRLVHDGTGPHQHIGERPWVRNVSQIASGLKADAEEKAAADAGF